MNDIVSAYLNNELARCWAHEMNDQWPQTGRLFIIIHGQLFNIHSSVWIPGAFLFSGFFPPIRGTTSVAIRVATGSLPRVISTPAPATKVRALGFSTDTVIWWIGNSLRHVSEISPANASKVWKQEASTTYVSINTKALSS